MWALLPSSRGHQELAHGEAAVGGAKEAFVEAPVGALSVGGADVGLHAHVAAAGLFEEGAQMVFFEHEGVLVRGDVLHRRQDGRWRLIEVKSTTSVKAGHFDEVGIQRHVVSRTGADLASVCLAHVNRNYVFQGGTIDVSRFFRIRNLTRQTAKLEDKITRQLQAEFRMLDQPAAPDIAAGRHCDDPVRCEFFGRCNLRRPADHTGYLPRIHASAVAELEEMGIESICDIPDDFPLNERQRRVCTSVQTGEPWFSAELATELSALKYPLCFMDFETVNPAIPRFPGMRPYTQLPFQWSVHVQREQVQREQFGREQMQRDHGAASEHFEFLALDSGDPRREFIRSLAAALGEEGSIVVYNALFESQRLSELAAWLPEYAEQIKRIQKRLWDLLPVVRNHVYHPAFAGSYSLKAVLPALVPEMTYKGMAVADGQDAGIAWESLVRGSLNQTERDGIEKALRDYCGQDTFAMVRLLNKLREHSRRLALQIN